VGRKSGIVTIDNVAERFPEWEDVWSHIRTSLEIGPYEGRFDFKVSRLGVNNVGAEVPQDNLHKSMILTVIPKLVVDVLWGSWFMPHIRVRRILVISGHQRERTQTMSQILMRVWGSWRIQRVFRVVYWYDPTHTFSISESIYVEIYEMPKNRLTTIRGLSRISIKEKQLGLA
jgi:hypothetical protein